MHRFSSSDFSRCVKPTINFNSVLGMGLRDKMYLTAYCCQRLTAGTQMLLPPAWMPTLLSARIEIKKRAFAVISVDRSDANRPRKEIDI